MFELDVKIAEDKAADAQKAQQQLQQSLDGAQRELREARARMETLEAELRTEFDLTARAGQVAAPISHLHCD